MSRCTQRVILIKLSNHLSALYPLYSANKWWYHSSVITRPFLPSAWISDGVNHGNDMRTRVTARNLRRFIGRPSLTFVAFFVLFAFVIAVIPVFYILYVLLANPVGKAQLGTIRPGEFLRSPVVTESNPS